MACLIAILALGLPRLTLILVYVLGGGYLPRAYETALWPVLGFFFMPLTTLAYAFGINRGGSIQGWYLALVVVAVLVDLGMIGGGGKSARRRKKWRR